MLTICRTPMEVVVDEVDGEPRWCFQCRKVREFRYEVSQTVEPSYYGPTRRVKCAVCNLTDGDMFPGRFRIWGED